VGPALVEGASLEVEDVLGNELGLEFGDIDGLSD